MQINQFTYSVPEIEVLFTPNDYFQKAPGQSA